MSKLITLQLDGFEEVIKIFEKLPATLQKKALRPALRAGAKIILKAAKAKSAKLTGKNRRFIKIKSLKRSRKSIGVMIQTGTREQLGIPRDEQGYYPMVLEYGSKNVKRRPFMKPALRENHAAATRAIGKALEKNIEKVVKKAAKKR